MVGAREGNQRINGRMTEARAPRPVGYNVHQHPAQLYLRCPTDSKPFIPRLSHAIHHTCTSSVSRCMPGEKYPSKSTSALPKCWQGLGYFGWACVVGHTMLASHRG